MHEMPTESRAVQFWLSKARSPRLGGVLGVKIFPRSERSLHGLPSRRGLERSV
jgi:hypothetical protein